VHRCSCSAAAWWPTRQCERLPVRAARAGAQCRAAERQQRRILAERYGADNGRVTRIIMVSTALAFVSFSGIAWMFGVRRD
jgi:hypothetical protein